MKAQRARNEFLEAARQPNNGCLKIGSWCFFVVYFLDFIVGDWQIVAPYTVFR